MKEIPASDSHIRAHFQRQPKLNSPTPLRSFSPVFVCRLKSHDALYPPLWRHHDVPLWFFPPKSHPYRVLFPVNTVPADGSKTFRQNFKGTQTLFFPLT